MPRSLVGHPNLILETLPEVCAAYKWKFESYPKQLWGENEWNKVQCRVKAPEFQAGFEVQQMPGCCAVLIASYLDPKPYTKSNFQELVGTIANAAYEAGFGSMMLSQVVRPNTQPKEHIWGNLLEMEWKMSEPFVNAKSGNNVVYLTKNLAQQGKRAGLEIKIPG